MNINLTMLLLFIDLYECLTMKNRLSFTVGQTPPESATPGAGEAYLVPAPPLPPTPNPSTGIATHYVRNTEYIPVRTTTCHTGDRDVIRIDCVNGGYRMVCTSFVRRGTSGLFRVNKTDFVEQRFSK